MKHARYQSGLSLVELMVAIAIGLFLMAGAVTIFTNSKRTYTETNDSSRMQESLRFAMDMIAHDVRMAGYFGCAYGKDPANFKNGVSTVATLFDTARGPLQGYDDSAATKQWWPAGPTAETTVADATATGAGGASVTPLVGSDAITIRHAGGPRWRVNGTMASASAAVPISNVSSTECVNSAGTVSNPNPECASGTLVYGGNGTTIAANDFVMVSSCGTGDVFQATSTGNTLSHATALAAAYDNNAVVSRVTFVRYYVGVKNGEPALWREINDGGNVNEIMLLPGVENLQITYGVDANADGVADNFLPAGAAGLQTADDWSKVIGVRIGIVARSQAANTLEQDTIARTVNSTNMKLDANGMLVDAAGAAAAANDNRRRRIMETTIMLRNRFLPANFGG